MCFLCPVLPYWKPRILRNCEQSMFCFLCFRMTVLFLIMWKEITSSIFRCGLSTKSSQMTRQDGYIPIGHVIFDAAIRDMHAPTERTDHRDPQGMNSFNLILQLSILMWILTTLPMCYSNISSLIFPLDPGCSQDFPVWCLAIVFCNLSQFLAILDETSPSVSTCCIQVSMCCNAVSAGLLGAVCLLQLSKVQVQCTKKKLSWYIYFRSCPQV